MSTVINGSVKGSVLSGTFVGETNIGSIDRVYVVMSKELDDPTIYGIYTAQNLAYDAINYDVANYSVTEYELNKEYPI